MTARPAAWLAFVTAFAAFSAALGGACTAPMYFFAKGTGGTGGSGAGGTGGAPSCAPGEVVACYTGPGGTQGQGICKAGTQTCSADGTGFGACEGEQLPELEDCATPVDEDCDGFSPGCGGMLEWSKRFGDGNVQRGEAVASDEVGNVMVVGRFYGSVDFGGGALTAKGGGIGEGSDAFVAKLDPKGNHLFSRRFGDEYSQAARAVAVDTSGHLATVGTFSGTIDFGGGSLPAAADGDADIFVAKLDGTDGAHVWSKSLSGDPGTPTGYAVAFDPAGDVFVAGSFASTIDLGAGPVTAGGPADVFVAKLDAATGAHVWSKTFGGPMVQAAHAIAVDQEGNVIVVGSFAGAVDFGGGSLSSVGGSDIFVAKLAGASGAHVWSESFGGAGDDAGYAVAIGAGGDVVVSGTKDGAGQDVFVAKLDGSGAEIWTKTFGDDADQQSIGVDIDVAGNIVLTGSFAGSLDFGDGGKISSAGGTDMFITKLNASGSHLWSKRYGDGSEQEATGVATDAAENVFVCGALWGSMDVGPELLTSAGTFDVVLLKLGH